jgi:quinol monooxygenase YgiN
LIHVIATVELHPNSRSKFLAEFATVEPLVRAEEGCVEYCAYIDEPSGLAPQIPVRPDVVTIIEQWTSMNALTAHAVAGHMKAYRQRVAHLVVKTSLQVLRKPVHARAAT